jgi:long-chain fatty acid transport protein
MRRSSVLSRLALSVPALACALFAGADAHASGYLTARFGSDHGTPASPNTYAVYYNPAALGGTTGTTITGDVALAVRWAHYKRNDTGLSPSGGAKDRLAGDQKYIDSNTGDGNLLNLLALPFAGVNTDFGGSKYLRGGYAVYIPFGGLAKWDKRDGIPGVPGTTDGVQRWHNISGQILAIYNTFAFAVTLPGTGLSFGLSASPIIHHVATVRARTADNSDDIERADGSLKEGRSYLDATGVNLGGSVGVYWQSPRDARIKLGLAYLAQPGFGTTRMKGKLEGRTAGGDVTQDIDFLQTYPHIFRLGLGWLLPGDKIELRPDFEYVTWSTFKNQCVVARGKDCNIDADTGAETGGTNDVILNIPRKWKDAIGARFGVGYFMNDKLELFGSGSFTTSAVPKETIDASTIDSFRIYGAAGARYKVSDHFAFAASYIHIFFLPVNTKDSNIFDKQQNPSNSPSADGKYTSQIGLLNLNVAYTF